MKRVSEKQKRSRSIYHSYMGVGTRFSSAEPRICGAAGGAGPGPGRMARHAISIELAPRQEAAATAADA